MYEFIGLAVAATALVLLWLSVKTLYRYSAVDLTADKALDIDRVWFFLVYTIGIQGFFWYSAYEHYTPNDGSLSFYVELIGRVLGILFLSCALWLGIYWPLHILKHGIPHLENWTKTMGSINRNILIFALIGACAASLLTILTSFVGGDARMTIYVMQNPSMLVIPAILGAAIGASVGWIFSAKLGAGR